MSSFYPVTARKRAALEALIERRTIYSPIAYLTGLREVWRLDFAVGAGVLIRRPESETRLEAEWPTWKSAKAKPMPSRNFFVRQNSSHAERFATSPVFPAASPCAQMTSADAKKAWQSCHEAVSFRVTWKTRRRRRIAEKPEER